MKKRIKWLLLSLGIILVGTVGYYTYSFIKFGLNIQDNQEDSMFNKFQTNDPNHSYEPPEWEGDEVVNVLLLGGDSRGMGKTEIPRSDSIMIASLNPETNSAYLFSIMRDTYANIPDHGMDKINAALAIGGPSLAMKTVSDLLDIPIQYYVYVDFQGFINLVDAVGGIDFYVEKNMHYVDPTDEKEYRIDLKKGMQHLDGNKALQYVRFRHDKLSDFTRTERQRNFMKALADKLQSTTSLLSLPSILNKIEPYIETNLSLDKMLRLGSLGFKIKSDQVGSEQLPPNKLLKEEVINKEAVITVDENQLRQFVKEKLATLPSVENGQKEANKTSE